MPIRPATLSLMTLVIAGFVPGCRPSPGGAAPAPYPVAVRAAQAVRGPLVVPLDGRIPAAPRAEAGGGRRDYIIDVDLPRGVEASVRPGQAVWVRLPVVRDARVQARVLSQEPTRVRLSLAGQVQALDGRVLQVELPLSPAGLVRLPFEAACSPRGLGVEVYALRQGRAQPVTVEPLALDDGLQLLVAGGLSAGEPVIWQGQDRLLAGDPVRVLDGEAQP